MSNPIVAGAAHFAATELDANKAAIEAELANGVKLLVADGTKLADEAAAKLPAFAAGAIDGLLSQYGGTAETAIDNAADAGVDALSAWLHGLAGDAPAAAPAEAPAEAPAPAAQ